MPYSIVLAFLGEGKTDHRFLPNIAERLIEKLLLEQNKDATIQWQSIEKNGEDSEQIIYNAAIQARYCTTLIIHFDSGNIDASTAFKNKIKPGLNAVRTSTEEVCKNVTVLIPITETEAWMLVDKELLKQEMNTELSNNDLGLSYKLSRIENIADPKQKLKDAIQKHHENLPAKRRKYSVTISELYEPISQKIKLEKLEMLSAYLTFKSNLISALQNENILN
jgi:hypothetical protein